MTKTFPQRVKTTLLILLFPGAIVAGIFLGLGVLVSFHAGEPQKADVIVVLGGDDGRRVNCGAQLYKQGYAPCLLLTGLDDRYYRADKPNWRERSLMNKGIPRKAIAVDTRSKTTWDEALNTVETMQKNSWKRAIVISDPPHMLRLHNTWTRALRGSSGTFVLVATRPEWWRPLLWWNNETSYRFVISEIKKNLFYALVHY